MANAKSCCGLCARPKPSNARERPIARKWAAAACSGRSASRSRSEEDPQRHPLSTGSAYSWRYDQRHPAFDSRWLSSNLRHLLLRRKRSTPMSDGEQLKNRRRSGQINSTMAGKSGEVIELMNRKSGKDCTQRAPQLSADRLERKQAARVNLPGI